MLNKKVSLDAGREQIDDCVKVIFSDKQLKEVIDNGKLVFINNNWIEYGGYILNKETGKRQFIELSEVADNIVDDDILEAINQVLDSLDQIVFEIKSAVSKI